jgi:hypothetical protein
MAKKAKSKKGSSYSDREVLEIFVESVDELLSSDFSSEIKAGVRVGLLAGPDGGIVTKCKGPRRDAIKAFLLTLRFFCQDNEPTSLRRMADRLSGLRVGEELKKKFLESRKNFNRSLDSTPHVPVHGVGADTKRDIFKAFLYGVFAHANPRHRKKVKHWEGKPYYADLEAQFSVILGSFLAALSVMANACREMLANNKF